MFEAVRQNKRISQVILAIIIVPFAFFGMDAYFSGPTGGNEVASVGESKISVMEFDRALRDQQDRFRAATGGDFDRALFESEAFRQTVLNGLVNQRVLQLHAENNRMQVTNAQVQSVIASLPAFQGEDGRFSLERYDMLLRSQNMTPAMFEAGLRQDLRVQQILEGIGQSAFTGTLPVRRYLEAQLEQREIRQHAVSAAAFLDQVSVEPADVQAVYEAQTSRFQRPERVRAQYVVLDDAAARARIEIPEQRVAEFYEANRDRFGLPEERRARHILILVDADAPEDTVAAARQRAEGLLEQLQSRREAFAELAATESQDSGSASTGGDLGFFGRGAMVAEFEDAVFNTPTGELAELVRSDFGFHIIEVTDVRADSVRPLESVRDDIVNELSQQELNRQFALLAEQFANTVYEQPDSLEPAAQMLGLEIRETGWLDRSNVEIAGFRNDKLAAELFARENRENDENIEAIEVARGVLLASRIVAYEPAAVLPFDEVREQIEREIRAERASAMAAAQGEAMLASLQAGQSLDEIDWSDTSRLQRGAPTLPASAMQAVFGTRADTVPAFAGVPALNGDFIVYQILSVEKAQLDDDDPRLRALADEYRTLVADKDFDAYLASLRNQFKVEVRAAALRANP